MSVKTYKSGQPAAPAARASTPEKAPSQASPIDALPAELLGQVMLRLDAPSWARVGLVSKGWRELARSPAIARTVAEAEGISPVLPALLRRPSEPGARWTEALVATVQLDAQLGRGPVALLGAPLANAEGARPRLLPSLHGPTSCLSPWDAKLPPLPLPLADERHVVVHSEEGGVEIRDFARPAAPGLRLLDRPAVAQSISPAQRWLALLAREGSLFAFDLTASPARPRLLAADVQTKSDIFFHPKRDELFYVDSQQTLRSILFCGDALLRTALGTLPGELSARQFSAGGELLAVVASNDGSVNVFDLRQKAGGQRTSFLARLIADNQIAFCGEEVLLLEVNLRRLHERDAVGDSPNLRARPFFEQPAHWPDGYTESRATRDGTWMAVWKSSLPWSPFAGAEFCLFPLAEPRAGLRLFGDATHAYEDVAFDRQNNRAAAMFFDHARREHGVYFVDLHTAERGESLWIGQLTQQGSGNWSLQFTADGAHLFVRGRDFRSSALTRERFWLPVQGGAPTALYPVAATPRSGQDETLPLHYGHRRSFFVDLRNGVWAAAATHPATLG